MRKFLVFVNIGLLFILAIAGCKKGGSPVVTPVNPIDTNPVTGSTNVYVSGISNNEAIYWKDNSPVILGSFGSTANKIIINGTDVYVAGATNVTAVANAVYWKNGNIVNLGAGYAYGIAVSGTDVYVAGDVINTTGTMAAVWKNGVLTTLGIGQIAAIQVIGTDVYMAGFAMDVNGTSFATYWKNNTPVTLDQGEATAIALVGTDVYVAGNSYQSAVYWKNGTKVVLTANSGTMDMAVSGSDIYISGTSLVGQAFFGGYWKNGVQTLFNKTNTSVGGIAVSGSNVYVAGLSINSNQQNTATLFNNGMPTLLSSGGTTDFATSVAVVTH